MNRLPSLASQRKKDYTLVIFLIVSIGLHGGAILMATYLKPKDAAELPPDTIEIELAGVPDVPPPLGTNDTETGPPEEAPTPPPVPEETPPPDVPPPPPENVFEVPEETPKPTPAPKPAATPKPKPAAKPETAPTGKPAVASGVNPNARPGAVRGVDAASGGVAGGVGEVKSKGGRADFISTPNMTVPYNLKQRLAGLKASARATVTYSEGRITGVDISTSSGNSALDSAIKRHVQSNFRVKAGASGRATLPVGIKI